jgi:hypothetical protein
MIINDSNREDFNDIFNERHLDNVYAIECCGRPILTKASIPKEFEQDLRILNVCLKDDAAFMGSKAIKIGDVVHLSASFMFERINNGEPGRAFYIDGFSEKLGNIPEQQELKAFGAFYCLEKDFEMAKETKNAFLFVKMSNGDFHIVKRINESSFTIFVLKSNGTSKVCKELYVDFNLYKKEGLQLLTNNIDYGLYYFIESYFFDAKPFSLHKAGLLIPARAYRYIKNGEVEATLEEHIFLFFEKWSNRIYFLTRNGLMTEYYLNKNCTINLQFSYYATETKDG